MARKRERKGRTAAPDRLAPLRRRLALPVILLLLAATASNVYLGYLYAEVQAARARPGAAPVSSFCAVSAEVNCVAVAESPYATLLGAPLALWGAEYYGALLLMVVASLLGWWRLRAWDSLVLAGMAAALPMSIAMAVISALKVRSLCLMCAAVYTSTILLLAILMIAHRRRLRAAFTEGPRELLALLRRPGPRLVASLLLVALASQPLWAGRLFGAGGATPAVATGRPSGGGPGVNPWAELRRQGSSAGPPSATVVIDEFSDFECPLCRRGHDVMVAVMRRFGDRVRLVHHDFPLDQACNRVITRPLHRYACNAAYYARCAAKQGKFWHFAAILFREQPVLDERLPADAARRLGLDLERLAACVTSDQTRQAVAEDIEDGIRRGVEGTPTYFVRGEKVEGVRELGFWVKKLSELLGEPPPGAPPEAATPPTAPGPATPPAGAPSP